jgi:hypothetical protein
MSLNPKRLTTAITYRIDGLGDGAGYARWVFVNASGDLVTFRGPGGEKAVLEVRRLYEVSAGHLHYASSD